MGRCRIVPREGGVNAEPPKQERAWKGNRVAVWLGKKRREALTLLWETLHSMEASTVLFTALSPAPSDSLDLGFLI